MKKKRCWKKLIDLGVEWLYPSHGKIFPIRLLEKEMEKKKIVVRG